MLNFLLILMIMSVSQDYSTMGRAVGDAFSERDFQILKAAMDRLLNKNLNYTPAETLQIILIVLFNCEDDC